MAVRLVWVVHVLAGREQNARRVLGRVGQTLDLPVQELVVTRYWKIPEQFVGTFTLPLQADTQAEVVFATLLLANRIGSGWRVHGPHLYEDGDCRLKLICARGADGRFSVPGVEWAHVLLDTSAPQSDHG